MLHWIVYSDSPRHNSVLSTNKPFAMCRHIQFNNAILLLTAIQQILHSSPASASSSPRSIAYSSSVNQNAFSISNNNPSRYIVRSFFPRITKLCCSNAPLDVVLETSGRTLSTPCCGCCPRHRVTQQTPPMRQPRECTWSGGG